MKIHFLALSKPNTEMLSGDLSGKGYGVLKIWKAPSSCKGYEVGLKAYQMTSRAGKFSPLHRGENPEPVIFAARAHKRVWVGIVFSAALWYRFCNTSFQPAFQEPGSGRKTNAGQLGAGP